jgi:fatty acid desaturase
VNVVAAPQTTDPVVADTIPNNPFERWGLGLLKDPRDLIFLRAMAKISAIVLPLATLLFMSPPWVVALAAFPYIGYVFLNFGGRFGLMLHANGHRPIFKRKYSFLSHYVPFVLGPFLGHTPTSFAAHHMQMHHAENNMHEDNSTTLTYRRDSFTQFLHYWARFFFFGHIHLMRYLWLRGKKKTFRSFVFGEFVWFAVAGIALSINWAAALVVFILPMLMMRWLMMAGNWAQHSFVDVDDPNNSYRNSTILMNSSYNHKSYNDGYHIIHHLQPGLHWSEMAQYFQDNPEEFAEQDSLVFDGIQDNQAVWFLLMSGNYDKLAKHLVNFRGRTHEELVTLLKERVQRTQGERRGLVEFESALGEEAIAAK